MGELRSFFSPLHTRTKRNYLARMADDKVACMQRAKEYGVEYWDGDRRFGYGGYRYDGRWAPVARRIAETYSLPSDARILDVGCGKAHLLYELALLLPQAELTGFDISAYAIEHAPEPIRSRLHVRRAEAVPYPWDNGHFHLVLSLGCLHNLHLPDLARSLREIERVGQQKYVMVESYQNDLELFNLQCWALTAAAFLTPDDWTWMFGQGGYSGDFEFIFFT